MKIAILGAGFTGLTAALRLSQKGHEVTIFEKEKIAGGLASGFKGKDWDWPLEKSYHHFFTNDSYAFSLARKVGQEILIKRPLTAIYYNNPNALNDNVILNFKRSYKLRLFQDLLKKMPKQACTETSVTCVRHDENSNYVFPFDSPLHLLSFHYLSISQKIRTGLVLAFLKTSNNYKSLEKYTAYEWLEKYMGKGAFEILFKPLFVGKFGDYADKVSMAWFWARIKKRTSSLAYPVGGYQSFINKLIAAIEKSGGKVLLNSPINEIKQLNNSKFVIGRLDNSQFDSVISTLPTPTFLKLTQNLNLPSNYIKRLTNINHLHALNLILELKESFFSNTQAGGVGGKAPDNAQLFGEHWREGNPRQDPLSNKTTFRPQRTSNPPYWLNINDPSFPFLALVEHTNFMDKKHYNNHYLLYIGNYLPEGHEYFSKSKEELLSIFDPYLKRFNQNYKLYIVNSTLHIGHFAQPIITTNYTPPPLETGLKNLYAGNLDNVYPWDRGTNYAIELGEKLANEINKYD